MIKVLGAVVGVDRRYLGSTARSILAGAVLARGDRVRVASGGGTHQRARNASGGKLHVDRGFAYLDSDADVDLWRLEDAAKDLERAVDARPVDPDSVRKRLDAYVQLLDQEAKEIAPSAGDDGLIAGHLHVARHHAEIDRLDRLKLATGTAQALGDPETTYKLADKLETAAKRLGDVGEKWSVQSALRAEVPILAPERFDALHQAVSRRLATADGPGDEARIDPAYHRAPTLIGRDAAVAELRHAVQRGGVVVLHGPAGSGRGGVAARVAAECVMDDWHLVRRLRASTPDQFAAGLRSLARELGWEPPTPGADDEERAASWLGAQLPTFEPWLLVVESVPDPLALDALITDGETPSGGAILAVTTNPNWGGHAAHVHRLETLAPSAALELLADKAALEPTDLLEKICERCDGRVALLRLAANQLLAGAKTERELLDSLMNDHVRDDELGPVARQVAAVDRIPGAATLLDVLAVIAPNDVPFRLFAGIGAGLEDVPAVRAIVAELEAKALVVRPDRFADTLSVNELEHRAFFARVGESQTRLARAIETAASVLLREMPEWPVDGQARERAAPLAPHADALAERASAHRHELGGAELVKVADLLGRVSDYRRSISAWTDAQRSRELAVILGERDPISTGPLRRQLELGNLLRKRGDVKRADDLIIPAIRELERQFGGDHLEVARARTYLARLHRVRGELPEALTLLKSALRVLENATDGDVTNRELADAYGWIAGIQRRLGNRQLARQYIAGALARCGVKVDDSLVDRLDAVPLNRSVLKHLRTLGTIERAYGRILPALQIQQFVLDRRIDSLGPHHHLVGVSHVEVARDELTLGHLARAEWHAEQANRIAIGRCGKEYPHRGTALVLSAMVDRERGEFDSARSRLQEARRVFVSREDAPSSVDHLDFAVDKGDCALLLAVEDARKELIDGNLEVLLSAQREVETVRQRRIDRLGAEHAHVATCDSALAEIEWLARQAHLARPGTRGGRNNAARTSARRHGMKAVESHVRALERRKEALDPLDPHVAWTYERIAVFAEELGDRGTAQDAWKKCLEIRVRSLGSESPLTERVAQRLLPNDGQSRDDERKRAK